MNKKAEPGLSEAKFLGKLIECCSLRLEGIPAAIDKWAKYMILND